MSTSTGNVLGSFHCIHARRPRIGFYSSDPPLDTSTSTSHYSTLPAWCRSSICWPFVAKVSGRYGLHIQRGSLIPRRKCRVPSVRKFSSPDSILLIFVGEIEGFQGVNCSSETVVWFSYDLELVDWVGPTGGVLETLTSPARLPESSLGCSISKFMDCLLKAELRPLKYSDERLLCTDRQN